mgnify:CR=1 FL=1
MAQWHRNIQDIITIMDGCIRTQQDEALTLRALADRLGVPHESTLAVGDSENDRAMLQKAGVAAVMANGMPEIRALAHLVSKADCDHDGVAEILETLGI